MEISNCNFPARHCDQAIRQKTKSPFAPSVKTPGPPGSFTSFRHNGTLCTGTSGKDHRATVLMLYLYQ
jgi:hypothetical protein